MGVTYVKRMVTGPTGTTAELDFLVDSGASYTLLPSQTWQHIGLAPVDSMRFRLADGTPIERQISECRIRLPQGERTTSVILGEQEMSPCWAWSPSGSWGACSIRSTGPPAHADAALLSGACHLRRPS